MTEKMKTAIIGCSRGKAHAQPVMELDEYELVGLCDLNLETAVNLKELVGSDAPLFTDYKEMLAETKPDIVAVTVPTSFHIECVLHAADCGVRGIVCEKPMARNLGEARKMVDACQEKGIPLIFEHQRRLSAPYQTMRRLIDEGAIGEIEMIRTSCAGQMITDGTHSMDLICYLAGDRAVEWVFGQVHRLEPDPDEPRAQGRKSSGGYRYGHPVEDGAMGQIQFADNVRAELLCGDVRLFNRGYQDVEVFGSEGRLWRASDRAEIDVLIQDRRGGWREAPLEKGDFVSKDADTRSYELFAATVRNGAEHPLAASNALKMFETLMAIYESARLNKKITLPLQQERFSLEIMIEEGRA